jgi:hypothetical protein
MYKSNKIGYEDHQNSAYRVGKHLTEKDGRICISPNARIAEKQNPTKSERESEGHKIKKVSKRLLLKAEIT